MVRNRAVPKAGDSSATGMCSPHMPSAKTRTPGIRQSKTNTCFTSQTHRQKESQAEVVRDLGISRAKMVEKLAKELGWAKGTHKQPESLPSRLKDLTAVQAGVCKSLQWRALRRKLQTWPHSQRSSKACGFPEVLKYLKL